MCQSHTGRLTGLWFLPKPAFGLNTNDDVFQNLYYPPNRQRGVIHQQTTCVKGVTASNLGTIPVGNWPSVKRQTAVLPIWQPRLPASSFPYRCFWVAVKSLSEGWHSAFFSVTVYPKMLTPRDCSRHSQILTPVPKGVSCCIRRVKVYDVIPRHEQHSSITLRLNVWAEMNTSFVRKLPAYGTKMTKTLGPYFLPKRRHP